VEAFGRHGIAYKKSGKDRSDIYLSMFALVNSGRVELLDGQQKMLRQFMALERKVLPSGKDSINHPESGDRHHDDLANVASLALVLASVTASPMTFPAVPVGFPSGPAARSTKATPRVLPRCGAVLICWAAPMRGIGQVIVPVAVRRRRDRKIEALLVRLGSRAVAAGRRSRGLAPSPSRQANRRRRVVLIPSTRRRQILRIEKWQRHTKPPSG